MWRDNRYRSYDDPATGERSAVPGALQIVFCDLGTPREGWNAYQELRDLLVERGVPRERVRFAHDATSDAEKARLFAACRSGEVAVLVGSTAKMGVGTNIQARAVALHHLDCPWRPADIEQREGRILRQGNQNPEVSIQRYVVEGSFDAYSWQTVERKARFISQVMRGRLDVREIEDVGDTTLSFAEVKALASGDPLILEKASADAERTRLERLQRAYDRNRSSLEGAIKNVTGRVEAAGRRLQAVDEALATRQDIRGDGFVMTLGDKRFTERADARAGLTRWAETMVRATTWRLVDLGEVGTLAGFTIEARLRPPPPLDERADPTVELALQGIPTSPASLPIPQARSDASSLLRQLEHRVNDLPDLRARTESERATSLEEIERARTALQQPFKHAGALTAARERQAAIIEEMQERQSPGPESAEGGAPQAEDEATEATRIASASFPTPAGTQGRPGARPAGARPAPRTPRRAPQGPDTDLAH